MQVLITLVLVLGFVSPYLCARWNLVESNNNNNIYNVMQYGAHGDGKSDDSQVILNVWNSVCGTQGASTLVIPAKLSFLVNAIIFEGPCKASNITVQLEGNIIAPSKENLKDTKHWIKFTNINNLIIDGRGSGTIDGYGSAWWRCESCPRPRSLSFHACNGLNVKNLMLTNSPKAHVSINGVDGATFSNLFVTAPEDSPNTDGFDISSSKNILIQDSTIKTGDDCIAVNGGSSDITATRLLCGPGHGISIGSLGKDHSYDIVEGVHVTNCTFIGTTNGARIKTFSGGSGYARKITFEEIILTNVKNSIIIDQHYDPNLANTKASDVLVSDVTFRRISGTSASDIAIKLDCSSLGCSNIILDQINIVSSQEGNEVKSICQNVHGTINSTTPKVLCT